LFTGINAAFFLLVIGMVFKAQRSPVVTGKHLLIGATGVAIDGFDDTGDIQIQGEFWRAKTSESVAKGQDCKVIDIDGLTLLIEPIDKIE